MLVDHDHGVLEVCSAISPVLYSDCHIPRYHISHLDSGRRGQGTMDDSQGVEYHGAWTARDTAMHGTSWPRRELWSKEHGARGQAMELKGRRERTIPSSSPPETR